MFSAQSMRAVLAGAIMCANVGDARRMAASNGENSRWEDDDDDVWNMWGPEGTEEAADSNYDMDPYYDNQEDSLFIERTYDKHDDSHDVVPPKHGTKLASATFAGYDMDGFHADYDPAKYKHDDCSKLVPGARQREEYKKGTLASEDVCKCPGTKRLRRPVFKNRRRRTVKPDSRDVDPNNPFTDSTDIDFIDPNDKYGHCEVKNVRKFDPRKYIGCKCRTGKAAKAAQTAAVAGGFAGFYGGMIAATMAR